MPTVNLYLFGLPRIVYQGRAIEVERRKALALTSYLALAELPQSRDALATLLWPDPDQEHSRAALRGTLYAMSSLLPESWLSADRQTIQLKRDAVWVDVGEFLALLARSRSHLHSPDTLCPQCVELLEPAIMLYREDFLSGFTLADSIEYDDWQTFQRSWLKREYAGVLRKLATFYGGEGQYEPAIACARRWLTLDPLHEPAHRMVMQLYAASGQRAEALRHYQECLALLDAELATPPEEATTSLYEAIKANTVAPLQKNSASTQATGVLPRYPHWSLVASGRYRTSKSASALALSWGSSVQQPSFRAGLAWVKVRLSPHWPTIPILLRHSLMAFSGPRSTKLLICWQNWWYGPKPFIFSVQGRRHKLRL